VARIPCETPQWNPTFAQRTCFAEGVMRSERMRFGRITKSTCCRAPAGFMASLAVVPRSSRALSMPWRRQLRRAFEGPRRLYKAVTIDGLLLYLRKVPRGIDQKSPSSVQLNQYRFLLQFYSSSVRLGRCALSLWHTDSADITSQYSQSLNEALVTY
jgi:hypothetical protein